MANLGPRERRILEHFLQMGSGYVLDFSDRTYADFFRDEIGIEIYQDKYMEFGSSKAKLMRGFWKVEDTKIIGKLVKKMIQYQKDTLIFKGEALSENDKLEISECNKIANQLLGGVERDDGIEKDEEEETFLSTKFDTDKLASCGLSPSYADALNQRMLEMKICTQYNAPLSVILMAGSTLEGILLSLAIQEPKQFNEVIQSPKKDGKVLPFSEWSLANLIDVCGALKYLREDVKKFSIVLRDFRNYIHPREQVAANFNPDIHTAKICLQVLKATILDLSKKDLIKDNQ